MKKNQNKSLQNKKALSTNICTWIKIWLLNFVHFKSIKMWLWYTECPKKFTLDRLVTFLPYDLEC